MPFQSSERMHSFQFQPLTFWSIPWIFTTPLMSFGYHCIFVITQAKSFSNCMYKAIHFYKKSVRIINSFGDTTNTNREALLYHLKGTSIIGTSCETASQNYNKFTRLDLLKLVASEWSRQTHWCIHTAKFIKTEVLSKISLKQWNIIV